jgi:glycine/D-amino acid oxidase-like deaminating enzyme
MTLPLWLLNKVSHLQTHKADVTIIGGGLVGLATAYWIKQMDPESNVIVVERLQCGSGASGRNAGFLTKGSTLFYQKLSERWGEEKAISIHRFASTSLELLHDQILQDSDIDFSPAQSLTLMRAHLNLPEQFGFEWSEEAAHSFSGFKGGYYSGGEFQVDPLQLITELRRKLSERDVMILEGQSAFRLSANLVETSSAKIQTDKIILCMNGYSGEFHPLLSSIIKPFRAQMLAVQIPRCEMGSHLFYDPAERVYFRKRGEGTLIIGGKRLLDEVGEMGTFEKLSPTIQAGLESYLKETLKLKFQVMHRWSGIMGLTQHELPYLEEVEAPSPTFIAAGFSGHGMGLGFHAAREMAEMVLRKKKRSFFSEFHKDKIRL